MDDITYGADFSHGFEKINSDPERSLRVKAAIERVFKDNKELLDSLGSDYDEDGVPYWENEGGPTSEKYEERLKYMEENGI